MSDGTLLVGFILADEPLFSALCVVVPSVGADVSYVLDRRMSDAQRAEWNEEIIASTEALRGRTFRVVKILHEFRKSGDVMRAEHHLVWCEVIEVQT